MLASNLRLVALAKSHPCWDRIERGTIDFVVVAVDNPDCTILGPELRHHHAELARELLGSIRGDVQALQDGGVLTHGRRYKRVSFIPIVGIWHDK
jgi:hypothetical protein